MYCVWDPQGSWSVHVCCLHLKMEFCSCARGRQWCGIIHYHWWTASIKPRLLFSRAGYASWGLSLSSVSLLTSFLLCVSLNNVVVFVYTSKSVCRGSANKNKPQPLNLLTSRWLNGHVMSSKTSHRVHVYQGWHLSATCNNKMCFRLWLLWWRLPF